MDRRTSTSGAKARAPEADGSKARTPEAAGSKARVPGAAGAKPMTNGVQSAGGRTGVAAAPAPRRKRDPRETRDRVLRAGMVELCRHGFIGARIDKIAHRAGCNMRMIYHYFGSKEGLYVAVLERVFSELRLEESKLHLEHLDPVTGVLRLVDFTMQHFGNHPEFIALLGNENLLRGKYLRKSQLVPRASGPLVEAIRGLLDRGRRERVFQRDVDPLQFYVSILSLCYVHVSNRYTLSITFNRDITEPDWLEARRRHVQQVVLCFLCGTWPPIAAEPREGE